MREQRFKPYSVSTPDGEGFVIGIQKEDGTVMSITDASEMLNEQQARIEMLEKGILDCLFNNKSIGMLAEEMELVE